MPRHNKWTNKEVARLRIAYPIVPTADLVKQFHPHPLASIIWMAKKLGLRKRKNWQEFAANHTPMFRFPPLPADAQVKRPWS